MIIDAERFDDNCVHIDMTGGCVLTVLLWWIPIVHNASMAEREKYEISRDRRMVVWDPDHWAINDEMRIDNYLAARA